MKQCFLNAFELVSDFDDPALIYAEGYALDRSHSSWPFLHAWCVRDALVIEPTLKNPERYVYFGILVPRRLLFDTVEKQEHVDILTGALAKKSMAALAKLHRSPK